eukprot:CAMPEP_0172842664 /NCGR_PEP_ID=MMETSP1075-20121228/30890_1 /TAXON_ID=2916 /ORGANISM="Ceratium fusus, Strain PA161109" /LENGTH=87 /DNA_ID=CAMNT_0013686823 /DNA_START=1352 /DNA_END=1615 /DNA_ORIENTATION=-
MPESHLNRGTSLAPGARGTGEGTVAGAGVGEDHGEYVGDGVSPGSGGVGPLIVMPVMTASPAVSPLHISSPHGGESIQAIVEAFCPQ